MKTHIYVETVRTEPGRSVTIEHVEWTPERPLDPHTRLPSTWRQPIGKKLTNSAILRRAAEGWYGPEWKNRVLASKKLLSVTRSGMAIKCACGKTEGVLYYRWSYLPKAGYYCPLCVAQHRDAANKEANERKRWRELMLREYV